MREYTIRFVASLSELILSINTIAFSRGSARVNIHFVNQMYLSIGTEIIFLSNVIILVNTGRYESTQNFEIISIFSQV